MRAAALHAAELGLTNDQVAGLASIGKLKTAGGRLLPPFEIAPSTVKDIRRRGRERSRPAEAAGLSVQPIAQIEAADEPESAPAESAVPSLLERLAQKLADEPDPDPGPSDLGVRWSPTTSPQQHEPTAEDREQDERERLLAELEAIAAVQPPDPRQVERDELLNLFAAERDAAEALKTAGGPERSKVLHVSLLLPPPESG